MSETKIIDKIQIDDIEASILGATISSGNGDGVSFGESNTAGTLSFATNKSIANGDYSHAEGFETEATGDYAHAEGYQTISEDIATHAEGYGTQATGIYSHTEGRETVTNCEASHAEGHKTTAGGIASHAEGYGTNANSNYSHAEGQSTFTDGDASHAEGYLTKASGNRSHAEGDQTNANGNSSHAEGCNTLAEGEGAHAEGEATFAGGSCSHAEGSETKAYGLASHAEGNGTTACGDDAHAEGANTKAGGEASHTEGYNTKTATEFGYLILNADDAIEQDQDDILLTLYLDSVAGLETKQIIDFDVSNEDINYIQGTTITDIDTTLNKITVHSAGQGSGDLMGFDFSAEERGFIFVVGHPELGSVARNGAPYAHAEGNSTQALGEASHSEGKDTQATGNYSHAEGSNTTASGDNSHAGGEHTIANGKNQTVIGQYNQENSDALFIVGNGSNTIDENNESVIIRKNAFEIKANGDVYIGTQKLEVNETNLDLLLLQKESDETFTNTTSFSYGYSLNNGVALTQYLNPPMDKIFDTTKDTDLTGEYQFATMERWCGEPVYTSVLKIQPVDNSARTKITLAGTSNCIILRQNGVSIRKNYANSYTHPIHEPSVNKGLVFYMKPSAVEENKNTTIEIRAQNYGFYGINEPASNYFIIAQIWYVKSIPQAIKDINPTS